MDENARSPTPLEARAVTREAMVQSALLSAAARGRDGLPREQIILSAKVSAVQDLIAVYMQLARRSDYALHLGLTEAGRVEGNCRILGGPEHHPTGGHRRYHPHFAHAGAGRRSYG